MRRAIRIEDHNMLSISEFELSKVVHVHTETQMIHFDRLKDGTWRLTYNPNVIPDLKLVSAFRIIRED